MERKSQHLSLAALGVLFLILVGLSFWQTSLDFGEFRPDNPTVTFVLWGVSTVVALGVFTVGFILFRSLLKLYSERRQQRLGSKIKTRLVAGAFILSIVPIISMVIFSFSVLNRTLDKWFSYPIEEVLRNSTAMTAQLNDVMRQKTESDAAWLASLPEAAGALKLERPDLASELRLRELARSVRAQYVGLLPTNAHEPTLEIRSGELIAGAVSWRLATEGDLPPAAISGAAPDHVWAAAPVRQEGRELGQVVVAWKIPADIQNRRAAMDSGYALWAAYEGERREIRYFYLGMMALITIFVLFVSAWLSLFLSRQISAPIEALVQGTSALSSGRFDYRIQAAGIDELGGLVESFNRMAQRLEEQTRALQESNWSLARANAEIDARRRFIDAILESMTPGVMSISDSGDILKLNSSVAKIFRSAEAGEARRLEDLFSGEDLEELRYMLDRARRTGACTREFESPIGGRIVHLAVTVSALEAGSDGDGRSGYAIVVEETTELVRAQRAAAWNEVARRVAHEIKNPLTPIALSAERISRQLARLEFADDPAQRADLRRIFERSTEMIVREVHTLRRLVDDFAQFARFPKATPKKADLNATVEQALQIFDGRLADVRLRFSADPLLPAVDLDPELFPRVVVNLVDNAAAAVEERPLREIAVSTGPGATPGTVELVVADSGPGVSAADKERLFLPYFSTKQRGTGLGLAIVSRIVGEHGGAIRVEDNRPSGARFIIELPVAEAVEPAGIPS